MGPEQPRHPARERAEGRWRTRGRRPTKGPSGDVRWWERPAPGGDEELWAAVLGLQERRITNGVSVTELARRLEDGGHPIRRETLSRVLNGRQPTSWATVEALAIALDADLPEPPPIPPAGRLAPGGVVRRTRGDRAFLEQPGQRERSGQPGQRGTGQRPAAD